MLLFRALCVGCSADRLGWLALSRGDERGGLRHAHVRERAVLMAWFSLRVRREQRGGGGDGAVGGMGAWIGRVELGSDGKVKRR